MKSPKQIVDTIAHKARCLLPQSFVGQLNLVLICLGIVIGTIVCLPTKCTSGGVVERILSVKHKRAVVKLTSGRIVEEVSTATPLVAGKFVCFESRPHWEYFIR